MTLLGMHFGVCFSTVDGRTHGLPWSSVTFWLRKNCRRPGDRCVVQCGAQRFSLLKPVGEGFLDRRSWFAGWWQAAVDSVDR